MAQIDLQDLDGDTIVLKNTGESYTRVARHVGQLPPGSPAAILTAEGISVPIVLADDTGFPAFQAMDARTRTVFLLKN